MKQQLEAIRKAALDAISDAGKAEDLEALRVRYLGKKGELTAVLKQMGKLSAEERPVIGQLANDVRAKLEANIEEKTKELADKAMELKLKSEAVDVTIPGKQEKIGVKHPMYQVLDEIKDIFVGMGFEILEDREVELAEYNFTKLNVEEGHPAREWSDTFYFTEDSSILLRTQTSPMQIHAMETRELPIRILAPGRVYRKDEVDATHSPMFHQIEGMAIDKGITMADLKGTLNEVVRQLYGEHTVTRFRPHHFPFTEPSCEMDIQCHKCHGKGYTQLPHGITGSRTLGLQVPCQHQPDLFFGQLRLLQAEPGRPQLQVFFRRLPAALAEPVVTAQLIKGCSQRAFPLLFAAHRRLRSDHGRRAEQQCVAASLCHEQNFSFPAKNPPGCAIL